MARLDAPWAPEVVQLLADHQADVRYHPYTCPRRGDGKHARGDGYLAPTVNGWICHLCDYTQRWCHDPRPNPEEPPKEGEAVGT
jgi:hypothetical protein